ncbi:MAG TPA: DUF4159 domain-containing protein [Vicinamibacterales bacterium]|nr:DUF4159 domain-containing protein [Vicinamibacterales bacterium]
MKRTSRLVRVGAAALLVALCVTAVSAQFRRGRRGFATMRTPTAESFDGAFNFCRVMFTSSRGGFGGSWVVDYPRADINLSIRFSELTKGRISLQPNRDPNHLLVNLVDPELFQCPFVMMTEVGSAYFSDEEAARLREYLQKGGFLWADDFWGSYAWEHWERELAKVLPPSEYRIVDLPLDHPLFRGQFEMKRIPQIPSINFWMGSGGQTSEWGADSAQPHARGISDSSGRLIVLITHNTDIGDSWEREADDPNYFYAFSVDGYAFGINVLLYAMTH